MRISSKPQAYDEITLVQKKSKSHVFFFWSSCRTCSRRLALQSATTTRKGQFHVREKQQKHSEVEITVRALSALIRFFTPWSKFIGLHHVWSDGTSLHRVEEHLSRLWDRPFAFFRLPVSRVSPRLSCLRSSTFRHIIMGRVRTASFVLCFQMLFVIDVSFSLIKCVSYHRYLQPNGFSAPILLFVSKANAVCSYTIAVPSSTCFRFSDSWMSCSSSRTWAYMVVSMPCSPENSEGRAGWRSCHSCEVLQMRHAVGSLFVRSSSFISSPGWLDLLVKSRSSLCKRVPTRPFGCPLVSRCCCNRHCGWV